MRLDAPKWLVLSQALHSKEVAKLNERQSVPSSNEPTAAATAAATSTTKIFPAPPGTFTLPPGPETLVISFDTLVAQEIWSSTTYLTTMTNVALPWPTEGPTIFYSETIYMPWATVYVEGDSSILVSVTATAETTASVVTSISCSSSVCSPTPTPIAYTCGIVDGVTQPVTTLMQSYSCTGGQICEGKPVKTTLTCGCGSPICTATLPLIPLIPVIVPVGAPIPPAVPGPPDVPEVVPEPESEPNTPETTLTEMPTTSGQAVSVSDNVPEDETSTISDMKTSTGSDAETNTSSDVEESDTSSTSSTTTSRSSSSPSSSTVSTSSNSSSTSASACSLGAFSIPDDFESTLSAWMAQYPFTLPTSNMTNDTTSTASLVASLSSTLTSSSTITPNSTTNTPTPTPSATMTTTMPKSTSLACDAACSSSRSSASSAFEAGLSSSLAAGHSSFTQGLSGSLSLQSASIVSASAQAISKCQHYTLSYPWNPPDIPATLATYNGNSDGGRWMCVIDPTLIDTSEAWNSTWQFQPFGVDKGWDRDHPKETLVDTFCNYLANEHVDVTPTGNVQGVCQAYDLGTCLNPTRSGQCTYWQHPWTTLDTWGPVMISVSYMRECSDMKEAPKPVDFGAVGADGCKKSLNALVNKCSFPKNKQKGWAEDDSVIGGTIWSDCMVYTMVGIREGDKPNVIWRP